MLDAKSTVGNWTHRYSNVAEYYRDATAPRNSRARISHTKDAGFSGSIDFETTQQRYEKGYPSATAEARQLILKLTPFLRTVRGTRKGWTPQRYAGGNFILSNYVRGIPEISNCMSPVISKKFASIILNGTASAGVSTDVMQKRGIAALALTQILEQSGYRVSVKLAYGESNNGNRQYCLVDLKPFSQTIELDRLAFFLADPSAFRRLHFSWMEAQPKDIRRAMGVEPCEGYGIPIDIPKSEIGEQDIYLGCASFSDAAWHSIENTQGWLKETLKRYGVEFYG